MVTAILDKLDRLRHAGIVDETDYHEATSSVLESLAKLGDASRRQMACEEACNGISTAALETGVVRGAISALANVLNELSLYLDHHPENKELAAAADLGEAAMLALSLAGWEDEMKGNE